MSAAQPSNQTGNLWTEAGVQHSMLVAQVAPDVPVDRVYTFAIPKEFSEQINPGQRVTIPWGRRDRQVEGYCLSIDQVPWTNTLKPILGLVDDASYFNGVLLELGHWMSRYYACPLGRTLDALIPSAVQQQSGYRTVRMLSSAKPLAEILANQPRIGPKQRALLEYLDAKEVPVLLRTALSDLGAAASTATSAARRGWVEISEERRASATTDFDLPRDEPIFELTQEQAQAFDSISKMMDERSFQVGLLFGVSGSGKTEVYVRAMRKVLAKGQQAIMLVPEIALTTQLVQRLACRFEHVAVIHSGLTNVQRSLIWSEIAAGKREVIIGTRSAVFAPCPNLGSIVVDEEQEGSFKNLQAPRYHVRDVAIKRGQLENIPVLLGSATPSLESWINCDRSAHYHRFELTKRALAQPMPTVEIVDMANEKLEGHPLASRLLQKRLSETLSRKEQAMVLLNRRGFSNWLACSSCRRRIVCAQCSGSMVYHASGNVIVCHYCSRRDPAPSHCPVLGCGHKLNAIGSGTQRAEELLQRWFPDKRIVRADSDTMKHRRLYKQLIDEFSGGQIDILVGTQMIAKGLDFPNVTCVGVIGGDAAGASTDFRAGERLFQLITQVAGRAGRAHKQGSVVVQSMSPNAPALIAAMNHDYPAFVERELALRKKFGYPPYSRLTRIIAADRSEEKVRSQIEGMVVRINDLIDRLNPAKTDILGPQPCILNRQRNLYRYDFLLRTESADTMQSLLEHLRAEGLLKAQVRSLVVDVDPLSLV